MDYKENSKLVSKADEHYEAEKLEIAQSLYEEAIAQHWNNAIQNKSAINYFKLMLIKNEPNNLDVIDELLDEYNHLVTGAIISKLKDYDIDKKEKNILKLLLNKEYGYWDVLGFGKYSKREIHSAIEKDPKYVLWSIINLQSFNVSPHCLAHNKLIRHSLFQKAIKHNIAKYRLCQKWRSEIGITPNIRNKKGSGSSSYGLNSVYGSAEEASQAYWNTH